MMKQHRRGRRLSLVARVMAMGWMTSCSGSAYASKSTTFSGEWGYAKRCDLGHYLGLHLQQHGDRVTGDWSEGTNAHGHDGQLQGEVRGGTLYIRYCSEDGGKSYAACPAFSGPEDRFRLQNGLLVRYQKYGSGYRRDVALHPSVAGKDVPFDQECMDQDEGLDQP